jgi:predicted RNA-binding protein with PUA-like domain
VVEDARLEVREAQVMSCWLLKTEPEVFSFADLLAAPKKTTGWNGVRNYQARNFLRDAMKRGDRVLIYHSNAEPSAVVGEAVVAREAYPDPTQFDPKDEGYDPASRQDAPRWFQVDVKAVRSLKHPVSLARIKATRALQKMELARPGSRLSVQPVTPAEYDAVVKLGQTPE